MSVTVQDLLARIHAAFDAVAIPGPEEILGARARNNIDALELRAVLAGRRWMDVPIQELFYNREPAAELSAVGLRAYLPAFMAAALAGDRRSPAIYQYTLFALYPLDSSEDALARERIALLDPAQRATIVAWLRYFADYDRQARHVLTYWE